MAAHQAPLSLGFSRQEHWSGLPFPSPVHESEVAQSWPTLCDPMDWSLPGSPVHGISQARVLEWGAIAFSVIRYMTCKYFLQFCLLSFQVFCRYFWISNIFDFDKVQFMFYSFIDCTSRVIAKNPLPNPRSWDLLICFHLRVKKFYSALHLGLWSILS